MKLARVRYVWVEDCAEELELLLERFLWASVNWPFFLRASRDADLFPREAVRPMLDRWPRADLLG